MDIKYFIYNLICKIHGHRYTCCGDPHMRCSRCTEDGRIKPMYENNEI